MSRRFTLMELLIVGVILALTSAFVLPKISSVPHRITVDNALADIRQACSETALRARATGKPVALMLDRDTSTFQLGEVQMDFPQDWTPSSSQNSEGSVLDTVNSKIEYKLSSSISWIDADGELVKFSFFPDGQASGSPIQFKIDSQTFQFDVDRLSGNALIMELK